MRAEEVQVSENGRIVIPVAFRKALGLKGGEKLTIRMDDHGLHIESRLQAIRRAQTILRKHVSADRRLSDELIAERRQEASREEKRG
jgi:AbrB family looped-hinge helix DNA binding protein